MSAGINMDELKRQEQYRTMMAEQKIAGQQKLDYTPEKHRAKSPKDALITLGVILGIILVLILLARGGII